MRIRHDDQVQARSRVSASRLPATTLVQHTIVPTTTVEQTGDVYHVMQGWRRENETWKGLYRIPGLQSRGEIWTHYGKFCARITDIPDGVLHGHHSACFAPDQERRGWYRIHFASMPRTVDGAILAVEQTLQEGQ